MQYTMWTDIRRILPAWGILSMGGRLGTWKFTFYTVLKGWTTYVVDVLGVRLGWVYGYHDCWDGYRWSAPALLLQFGTN
jgi:hypothetical protein